MKKIWLIPVLILFLALASGCAHKPGQSSATTLPGAGAAAEKPAAAAETGTPPAQTAGGASSDKAAGANSNGEFNFLEDEEDVKPVKIADPLEPYNRAIFRFNDDFYIHILNPVAKGYRSAIPYDFRLAFKNFFHNLSMPVRLASCILQGNPSKAGTELGAFLINSTAGVAGFGDPAGQVWGIEPTEEDIGQTLGVWGLGHGFYIIWPVLGPSSLRDSTDYVAWYYLEPLSYLEPTSLEVGSMVLKTVNAASFTIGDYESLKGFSLDPYLSIRNAYVQRRAKLVDE